MSKKKDIPNHKLAVLISMLVNQLDELKPTSKEAIEIHEKAKELETLLEPVLDNLYNLKGISGSVYFQELENKVDTVIRKNYQKIEQ